MQKLVRSRGGDGTVPPVRELWSVTKQGKQAVSMPAWENLLLCFPFQGHTLGSILAILLKLQVYLFKDTPKFLSYLLIQNTYFSWKKITYITPTLPTEWKEPWACWISALSPAVGKHCTISFSLWNTSIQSQFGLPETVPSFFYSSKNVRVRKNFRCKRLLFHGLCIFLCFHMLTFIW